MATWSELLDEFNRRPPEERGEWIATATHQAVAEIAAISNRNVIAYTSAFLQKPQVPGLSTTINREDINGFMAGVHGLDPHKSLLLLLHTPGGLPDAAQTIVSYLRSKYADIHAVIPTYAMSAGTMVALGCDRIIMGRQSQLGPTDPQLVVGQRPFSAHSIVSQFDQAKNQIVQNPVTAHAWAPVLRTFGPALLEEARKSLEYTRSLVENCCSSTCSEPAMTRRPLRRGLRLTSADQGTGVMADASAARRPDDSTWMSSILRRTKICRRRFLRCITWSPLRSSRDRHSRQL